MLDSLNPAFLCSHHSPKGRAWPGAGTAGAEWAGAGTDLGGNGLTCVRSAADRKLTKVLITFYHLLPR